MYHWCIVSTCTNTSKRTPNKIFIQVPLNKKTRNSWLQVVRREPKEFSATSKLFICEDHFDLENDMENYIRWKLMGGKKVMKYDAIPRIFPEGKEIISDIKDIDVVSHILCEDPIKREILSTDITESKQQVFVKTEIDPLIKTENISQSEYLIKTETPDQELNEVKDSNEPVNTLGTDEQLVHNFSTDLHGISVPNTEKSIFAECYSDEGDKEEIKIIEAPVIPVEPHEYFSETKDKYVCNYCQQACNKLQHIKRHITHLHREVTRIYQCLYCLHKSKYMASLQDHIIRTHKDTKDIQWFKCDLCDMKFKVKSLLTKHRLVHLTHEQMKDKLKICLDCGKTFKRASTLKSHIKCVHYKERKKRIKCQECEYTTVDNRCLKLHFNKHHVNVEQTHELQEPLACGAKSSIVRYRCDKCGYKTYRSENFTAHNIIHLKPEEIQYFYCYHCSYKSKRKGNLRIHIFTHFKNALI